MTPAAIAAVPGQHPVPLNDPRERAIALHESSHCVVALARRGNATELTCCRVGTALATECVLLRGACFATPDAVIYFAGTIGACLGTSTAYCFADLLQTRMRACARRADAKKRPSDSAPLPPPGSLTESAWDAVPSDGVALSTALHSTGIGDSIDALEYIENETAGISDIAERNLAVEIEWHAAQSEALKLCVSWLDEIRDLAALLCEHGGILRESEILEFWARARQTWGLRQAEKVIAKLKK